ncbi:hypothetical protein BOTBODRAFT_234881 [Botryobasidium botryosum FD-172 SS1]|uniref:Chromo domain-containing protein n=1 Tax=Botryobasidium botryosum (strain FD-172 SS1) TaxID=930990 RepID=A0A067LWW7_BOTB1|nr:hypothetical protein BOTBODRAFT_234881 [Botryobasidium botryosum FD-172 SS1]
MPRKSAKRDDSHIWCPSDTSQENWGTDISSDEEWEVGDIHDCSIDSEGRIKYKLDWKEWKRADGSNTTWESPGSVAIKTSTKDVVGIWERRAARKRAQLAEETREIFTADTASQFPLLVERDAADINIALREKLAKPSRPRAQVTTARWNAINDDALAISLPEFSGKIPASVSGGPSNMSRDPSSSTAVEKPGMCLPQ